MDLGSFLNRTLKVINTSTPALTKWRRGNSLSIRRGGGEGCGEVFEWNK